MDLCVQDYKSLCTTVMTCATLVVPKLDSYILTPVTLESRSTDILFCIHVRCNHYANLVTAGPQVPEILYILCDRLKPIKVGQGGLLFVYIQGSLVGHCMQYYKCLCTAVTICASLFVPKFDLSIVTPLTSKSRPSLMDSLHPFQIHP